MNLMGIRYEVKYSLLSGLANDLTLDGAYFASYSSRDDAQARADYLATAEGSLEEIRKLQESPEYAGMQLEIRNVVVREIEG